MSSCTTNYATQPQHNGYARVDGDSAHRREWKREVGPIPDGHEIHHLCGNKACHKLTHLALIEKNKHRQLHAEMRTHCWNGHPWSQENTKRYADRRFCRACDRIRHREMRNV